MKRSYLVRRMSEKLNYLSDKVILEYYYEFIRVIIEDLRRKGEFELPDFGKFKVLESKPRRSRVLHRPEIVIIPSMKIVKFYSYQKLKTYFKNLS
jgi:nucleoid DNA-binding protein